MYNGAKRVYTMNDIYNEKTNYYSKTKSQLSFYRIDLLVGLLAERATYTMKSKLA
jgi:hypothetical protein